MRFTESQLSAFTRCEVGVFPEDLFWSTILTTAKSILLSASGMRIPEISEIRSRYSHAWSGAAKASGSPELVAGHRKIPGIARRTAQFVRDYQVIVPVMEVELPLEGGSVMTEYAVAKPWRKDEPWLCVSLQRSKAPQYYQYPDPVSLARWLDLSLRERFKNIHLYQLPLMNGNPWMISDLSKPLVRQYLTRILARMCERPQSFRPGPHCESCKSHACLEMLR